MDPEEQERLRQQQALLGNTNQQSRLGGLVSGIAQSLIGSAIQQPQLSATPMQATTPELAAAATEPTAAVSEFLLSPDRPTGEQAQAIAEQQTEAMTPSFVPTAGITAEVPTQGVSPEALTEITDTVQTQMMSPAAMRFASPQFAGDVGIARTRAALQEQFGAPTISQLTPSDSSSAFEQASAAREARIDQREQDSQPRTYGGFKSSELRDIVGGGDALKRAKALADAGLNPITGRAMPQEPTEVEQEVEQTRLGILKKQLEDFGRTEPDRLQKSTSEADRLIQAGLLDEQSKQAYILGQLGGDVDALLGSGVTPPPGSTPTTPEEDSGFKIVQ